MARWRCNWYQFHVTRDASANQFSVYENGSLLTTDTNVDSSIDSDDEFLIGAVFGLGGADVDPKRDHFDGLIDEVRISGTERSADWIETENLNQRNPNAFYSVEGYDEPSTFWFLAP